MPERIQQVMEHYGLNASQFSTRINIKKANVSHVLNGRNKPSLDFIIAVLECFEEINPDWLLLNRNSMFSETLKKQPNNNISLNLNSGEIQNNSSKKVKKIILLLDDFSLETYVNEY